MQWMLVQVLPLGRAREREQRVGHTCHRQPMESASDCHEQKQPASEQREKERRVSYEAYILSIKRDDAPSTEKSGHHVMERQRKEAEGKDEEDSR